MRVWYSQSESSNNAKEGGGLCQHFFGIPGFHFYGDLYWRAIIAFLWLWRELEVGQVMLKIIELYLFNRMAIGIANVFGTILCIALSSYISKITNIRFALVAPFVFMIIAFAFQSGQNLMDLVALFTIGLLGILMRRFDWSRPAFLIGFVLANPVEVYQ